MKYEDSKKRIDKIRREYGTQGDVLFRTAIQYVVEYGKIDLCDKDWYQVLINDIDDRHDLAEKENKHLFVTRDFEKAIIDCAVALCEVDTYDLLTYIQREVWFCGNGIDYQRAINLLQDVLNFFVELSSETAVALQDARDAGFTNDEIEDLGFGWMLDMEEE